MAIYISLILTVKNTFLARDGKRSLFNARVESAMEKPTFKDSWISPASNPEEIVPFALSDMVIEKAEG